MDSNPYTLASYLLRCFGLLKTLTLSIIGPTKDDVPGRARPEGRSESDEAADLDFALGAAQSGELLIKRMAGLLRAGTLTGAAVMLQAVTIIENWLRQLNFAQQVPNSILNLMEAVAAQMRKLLRDLTDVDENIRMRTEVIDIVITIVVGLFRDRVLFDDRGLDAINQFDYREWLFNHGATKTALELPLPDRDLRLRLRLRGRRAPEAASRRRRGGARGAADVLHLSRRDVLARALRHGRRRLRTALQGSVEPARDRGELAGPVSLPPRARRPSSSPTRAAVTSRRCISGRRPTAASWTG